VGADSGRAFAPLIVFIPRSGDECKPGEADSEWLPRQCPACQQIAIIGHGRRRRQMHDAIRHWIVVRRGLCKSCDGTLTVLPATCVPGALYTLVARQQARRAPRRATSTNMCGTNPAMRWGQYTSIRVPLHQSSGTSPKSINTSGLLCVEPAVGGRQHLLYVQRR
jgi:hypothetical protein